ncbi:MAG TPA: PilZ domain-containing protein [Thermoanaerobaculia bacterium]|nr:PilZ domain-containing protein [Thermoanaerobaculia bacterium]
MSNAFSEVDERRQYGRVTPVQRIRGTVGEVVVFVLDVSLAGARVAHQDPLPPIGGISVLKFEWEARKFSAPCEVRRTRTEKTARSQFEKPLYHTGLFLSPNSDNEHVLRDIVAASVARALDEQKANANGIPAVAAQSFQTGKGDDFIRYELRGGSWSKTATRDPRQPHGEGFTISASETPTKASMLCRAYESGDAEGRKLIRTFASLSISKVEGVPTRRYTP